MAVKSEGASVLLTVVPWQGHSLFIFPKILPRGALLFYKFLEISSFMISLVPP